MALNQDASGRSTTSFEAALSNYRNLLSSRDTHPGVAARSLPATTAGSLLNTGAVSANTNDNTAAGSPAPARVGTELSAMPPSGSVGNSPGSPHSEHRIVRLVQAAGDADARLRDIEQENITLRQQLQMSDERATRAEADAKVAITHAEQRSLRIEEEAATARGRASAGVESLEREIASLTLELARARENEAQQSAATDIQLKRAVRAAAASDEARAATESELLQLQARMADYDNMLSEARGQAAGQVVRLSSALTTSEERVRLFEERCRVLTAMRDVAASMSDTRASGAAAAAKTAVENVAKAQRQAEQAERREAETKRRAEAAEHEVKRMLETVAAMRTERDLARHELTMLREEDAARRAGPLNALEREDAVLQAKLQAVALDHSATVTSPSSAPHSDGSKVGAASAGSVVVHETLGYAIAERDAAEATARDVKVQLTAASAELRTLQERLVASERARGTSTSRVDERSRQLEANLVAAEERAATAARHAEELASTAARSDAIAAECRSQLDHANLEISSLKRDLEAARAELLITKDALNQTRNSAEDRVQRAHRLANETSFNASVAEAAVETATAELVEMLESARKELQRKQAHGAATEDELWVVRDKFAALEKRHGVEAEHWEEQLSTKAVRIRELEDEVVRLHATIKTFPSPSKSPPTSAAKRSPLVSPSVPVIPVVPSDHVAPAHSLTTSADIGRVDLTDATSAVHSQPTTGTVVISRTLPITTTTTTTPATSRMSVTPHSSPPLAPASEPHSAIGRESISLANLSTMLDQNANPALSPRRTIVGSVSSRRSVVAGRQSPLMGSPVLTATSPLKATVVTTNTARTTLSPVMASRASVILDSTPFVLTSAHGIVADSGDVGSGERHADLSPSRSSFVAWPAAGPVDADE